MSPQVYREHAHSPRGLELADGVLRMRLERLTSAERVWTVLLELGARWHRAEGQDGFTQGRRAAYAQAVSLLLDCDYASARQLLEDGWL